MSSIAKRRTREGVRFLAEVRLQGFDPVSKGGFPTRQEAKAWAEKTEETLKAERARGNVAAINPAALTFRHLRELHLKDPEVLKLASFEARADQLTWWADWCEATSLITPQGKRPKTAAARVQEFIGPANITAARDQLHNSGLADQTVNNYIAAARRCINWARTTGKIPASWVWPPGLTMSVDNERDPKLTREQAGRILIEADAESPVMFAAVVYAIGVGARIGEQLETRYGDIREAVGTTAIDPTKTDTARRTHLPPAVLEAIRRLYDNGQRPADDEFVFRHEVPISYEAWAERLGVKLGNRYERPCADGYTRVFVDNGPLKRKAKREGLAHPTELRVMTYDELNGRWERIRTRAGVPWLRWHDLRHVCASLLIQAGAQLAEIRHQLGHKRFQTTLRYAHLIEGVKPTGADRVNSLLEHRPARTEATRGNHGK